MSGVIKLEQLTPKPPHSGRWRVWLEPADSLTTATALIKQIAPATNGALELLSGTPSEREFVQRHGAVVHPSDVGRVVAGLQGAAVVLRWPTPPAAPDLEVLCSLYDDNLEVQSAPGLREPTELVLRASLAGGA